MNWRLRTSLGDEIVVVRDRDARNEDRARCVPSLFIRLALRDWLLGWDGLDRTRVMDMYRELRGEPSFGFSRRSASDLARYVLPVLEDAFEHGRLVAFKVPRPTALVAFGPPHEQDTDAGPDSEPANWVEVIVTDDEGEPYLGTYRLDLPDGRALAGRFNMGGAVRADGIPGGSCTIAFPELHVAFARGT